MDLHRIRTDRKPWFVGDIEAELKYHSHMLDVACRGHKSDFIVICDCVSPPPPAINFLLALKDMFIRGYPDRLYKAYTAPSGKIISSTMNTIMPLLPGSLSDKLLFVSDVNEMKLLLSEILLNGENDVPSFFG